MIDLFHNGGGLIYSFICTIISLSDLVSTNPHANEVRKENYRTYIRIY